MTTTTPGCLQRLLYYNDDNMVDPMGSTNATGNPKYLFLSLLFIYVLFFLSVFHGSFFMHV
jgi:hypothetical protein